MAIDHKNIAAIREDYVKDSLSERQVSAEPLQQFTQWFEQAMLAKVIEPNAMTLSTISEEGFPSSRIVLLKDIKVDGLSFFTNYESQKGLDMARCAKVGLLFFWPELQRQVRIEGLVERICEEDSDEYFASRPKGSRIGAWASPQSQIIPDRDFLEQRVNFYEQQFAKSEKVDRPLFWGGYLVKPVRMEFWQGRSSRLHDRIVYFLEGDNWVINRLAP
ncbi:Pyridoxamine 5'-phosphate oxidase [Sphingobacterium nematocida]|uniref:Pyridoxine/pyridoxamine 5'-phosphate oxidase n=1 Tax=Sphingobacterium nematocida TaxID=1513896 RepID=A0A1T5C114_9SPHI|nr:pyridoxamine 5'-phosphate oxidase [Sphingobacterium nematocida]SKB53318.1 Pyridoxamine 5'-phosphate oxidase [Sphingobacterium nematocida]